MKNSSFRYKVTEAIMKENFTSINVVIDRSGSMSELSADTIGGFNQFLQEQKDLPGEAVLTLCTFSTDYTIVHDCVKLADVPKLTKRTYVARGGTALLDALGTTIDEVGKKLAAMPEEDRPSKVLFLVITDGEENSSEIFTRDQIKEKVEHQKNVYKWDFVFMGANLDSIAEGGSIGIAQNCTMNYSATPAGTRGLYLDISKSVTRYRTQGPSNSGFFDDSNGSK
jgi:uncharacterized protein YegL